MSSPTSTPPPDQISITPAPTELGKVRNFRPLIWTILIVIALGAMSAGAWWWLTRPKVHFVAVPPAGYDALTVPPLHFSAEDAEAIAGLPWPGEPIVLDGLKTSGGVASLADRLQSLNVRKDDTLIVYLHVDGVSDDGSAWLLWDDYRPTTNKGRCTLDQWLEQLKKCPAGKKLLILDSGNLLHDVRMGMFVNEFPMLLDDAVRKVDDPNLWVLASHRPLEISQVSRTERRSVFAHYVAEGLAGAADRNGDGTVELAELVHFVRFGVSPWVAKQTGDAEAQTPWLLHGGQGAVRAPANMALLPVLRSKAADRRRLAAPSPADRQVGALLTEAWRLRDRAERRTKKSPWTPVDYAPHLWRAYQELLLDYEFRRRAGAQYDAEELAKEIKKRILPLGDLLDGKPLPDAVDKTSILGRLADARTRFLAKAKRERFDQSAKDKRIGRYFELVRLKNDYVFRARDYVRWHSAAARGASKRLDLYHSIHDFLGALGSFVGQLEAFETETASMSSTGQIEQSLTSLDLLVETLEPLSQAVDQDGLRKMARSLAATAERNPTNTKLAGPIDGLLATPILPADLRAKLLVARNDIEQPFTRSDELTYDELPRPLSLDQWNARLYDQAALDRQLVELAEPSAARMSAIRFADVATTRKLLERYKWFGKALGEFYAQLPKVVNEGYKNLDPEIVRRSERWLRAVEACDATEVLPKAAEVAVRGIKFSALKSKKSPRPAKRKPSAPKAAKPNDAKKAK